MTTESIQKSIVQLSQSERGHEAMTRLLSLLENGGMSLDGQNQHAILTLFLGAFELPSTTLVALRNAVGAKGDDHV
jgi:hypothetical protein